MIKILVIGESCTDKFIYCETTRFSPEAPVPVLTPIEEVNNLGMSGNVVRNIKALKEFGEVHLTHVFQEEDITKTRFVEKKSNHMFIRLDEGESNISKFESKNISFSEFDIVIVSDYNKGFLSDNDLVNIGKNSKLSILDSKRRLNSEIVQYFTFIKLNEVESKQNPEWSDSKNILVTMGSKGTKWSNEMFESPDPQETIDVSGAGDTFTASFILKYYTTKDVKESIIFANKMASIVVSKRGVATP